MGGRSDPSNGFTRTIVLVEYKPVLRSTCDYCGLLISGVTAEMVWALESDHREYCHAVKKPTASSFGE